jgi:hypothetical protein
VQSAMLPNQYDWPKQVTVYRLEPDGG